MNGASTYSGLVDKAFWLILGASVIMLLGVTVTMIYFIVKYRRSKNPNPAQIADNVTLETVWTILPTILVLVMFYYGWAGFRVMRDIPSDSLPVTVHARMWSWAFEYENGKQSTELIVPEGRPVSLDLQSADVIHSFFVPAFRLKEDCMPGHDNKAWFEANRTGTFDIFCAEYCGDQHSAMLSKVVVLPAEEFDTWLTEDAPRPTDKVLLQLKGCVACHTSDGTKLIGPSFKGLFGKTEMVKTGEEIREIVVDEEYLRRSILDPNADIVEGYQPVMPPIADQLNEEDIEQLIEYIKRQK